MFCESVYVVESWVVEFEDLENSFYLVLCSRFSGGTGDGELGEKGITWYFHLEGRVHVEMGTFSKAFGVVGGYVSGGRDLINFAYNKSRTWLLSGSHPPAVTAASIAAVDVLEDEPEHVQTLG